MVWTGESPTANRLRMQRTRDKHPENDLHNLSLFPAGAAIEHREASMPGTRGNRRPEPPAATTRPRGGPVLPETADWRGNDPLTVGGRNMTERGVAASVCVMSPRVKNSPVEEAAAGLGGATRP